MTEPDFAVAMLASMDWDVMKAMEAHFAGGEGEPAPVDDDVEPEVTFVSGGPAGPPGRRAATSVADVQE